MVLLVKNPPVNAGVAGLIPGLGRSPGGGNGNPLRDFSLENPMDRGAWRAMVCRVAKSWTRLKQLSTQGMLISCFRYSLSSLVAQTVKHLSTMRETRVRSLDWEDPLEKELAIHSRTIAWKIPWTEEPRRLQYMGSQRIGHNWATLLTQLFRPQGTHGVVQSAPNP